MLGAIQKYSRRKKNEENQTAVFALSALSLSPRKVKCSFTPLPNSLSHPPPQRIFPALALSIYGIGVTLPDNGSELQNVGKSKYNRARKRESPL